MSWYNSNWLKRQKLTINAAQVGTVHVDISSIGLTLARAGEIRITKADGTTELAREVVTANDVHFKADILSAITATDFYIYYDNSAATDYAVTDLYGAQNAWSSVYEAVYHKEGGAVALDSTANGLDGTWGGNLPTNTVGILGNAQVYDNTANFVDLGKPPSLAFAPADTFTITAWINKDTLGAGVVFSKGDNSTGEWNYRLFVRGTREITVNVGNANFDSGHFVTEGEWEKVGLRVDGGNFEVIINGAVVTSGSTPVGTAPTYDSRVLIGARTDSALPETEEGFFFDGGIDEVYFRSSFVSDDELSAEYTNINSPATFYTLGAVETEVISGAVALTDRPVSLAQLGDIKIGAAADITGGKESMTLAGVLLLSGQAALNDATEDTNITGILFLSGQAGITDGQSAIHITGKFGDIIQAAAALTDKSSSIGAGGGLLITGQAAAEEEPASIMIGAEMLISMNAALQDDAAQIAGLIDVLMSAAAQIVDAGESVLINGSLLNEASASITITDEGASFSAVGGTYISGDSVVTDSDSTVSLDTSMIMGMNAALQVNPESVQLFSDVIISATIALADNPTALFIEELAISPKLRIIVTGARIGNTITLTGKKVARTLTVDA